ncbi:MAG TPA: hypothetical protein VEF76_09870 [Patescibacteria group bacterium]|nr:hypothetical protein [Patescibacteria group bacterium]
MSFKDLTVSLSEKFNWLASPPDRHFTMGEAINWITDGELARGKDIQWNRAGRFVDRATMVVGLGVTAAVCVAEASVLPILLVPLVFKGVAFVAAGITEGIVNKMAAAAETLERLTTEREYKKTHKKDLPRGMR